ncbi:MAG: SDR family oxidoreductase [Thermomicrobiales bacterium]|jgi:3-oxoacyl-[acyl-carrier protein] reductase|nr:SDR family NAD(P)-dependent oxidoreductase [Thermomicrobiales bacterium]
MADFAGQVAIVTGASHGVGRAVALALAREGAAVGLIARREAGLRAVADEIAAAGGQALALPADVADEQAIGAAVNRAAAELGGLDIVIANAGIGGGGRVADLTLTDWNAVLATNLTGVFLTTRAALPHLHARGRGQIIAVSSGAGRQGYAGMAAYCASKFGLQGYMEALAAEVKADNIRCGILMPGSIRTDFGGRSAATKSADGRGYLLPEDVAASILHQLRQPPHAWAQLIQLWPFS